MKHLECAFQGRNGIGGYIALLLIIFIGGSIVGSIPLATVMLIKSFSSGSFDAISSNSAMDFAAYGISNNFGLILLLFSFIAVFFFFFGLIKPLHGRTLNETINGRNYIRWNRIWTGIIVWAILLLVSFAVSYFTSPEEFEFQFNPSAFFGMVLILLLMMPFQTSIEEILFRGYLAQGVAKWTKSRWMALIIPSVLFALMHAPNPEVKEFGFWLMMPNYLIMALLFGLISILDDGIELALGIHFINNALSSVLVTHSSSVLQTDALFVAKKIDPVYSLIEMAVLAVLAIYILQRIYKWDFGIINKKVAPNTPVASTTEIQPEDTTQYV